MYKNILVAIDVSNEELGKSLVGTAKEVAGGDSKITIANIVEDIPVYVAAELPGGLIDKANAEARKILEKIVREADVDAGIEVRSGSAYRAILAIADERNADLIILASHTPRLDDWILGSTAARVVRHAKCSVLVER